MSTATADPRSELQQLLRKIAGSEGSIKTRIGVAARKLRWNYSRTQDCWYQSRRASVRAEELQQAREAARETLGTAQHDIETLQARIESLESTVRALLAR